MKKVYSITITIIILITYTLIFPQKVQALSTGTTVTTGSVTFNASAIVNGSVKKGQTIEIKIETEKIDSIYAADIYLKYDNTLLKVISMEKGKIISDDKIKIFEVENKFDNEKGTARLQFSCLGKINGFSGSGTLLTIKAEILKDGKLIINSKPGLKTPEEGYNLKLQLVDKEVKEMSFKFTPYDSSATNSNDANSKNVTIPKENIVIPENPVNVESKDAPKVSQEVKEEVKPEVKGDLIDTQKNVTSEERIENSLGNNKYSKLIYIVPFILLISVIYLLIKKQKNKKGIS